MIVCVFLSVQPKYVWVSRPLFVLALAHGLNAPLSLHFKARLAQTLALLSPTPATVCPQIHFCVGGLTARLARAAHDVEV